MVLCQSTGVGVAGDIRAYTHRITDNVHCTVLFTLLIGKPLIVWHVHISCKPCALEMTTFLYGGKRQDEITEDNLNHSFEYFRNIKHGPTVTEEDAVDKIRRHISQLSS